jgi:hypothetical protein
VTARSAMQTIAFDFAAIEVNMFKMIYRRLANALRGTLMRLENEETHALPHRSSRGSKERHQNAGYVLPCVSRIRATVVVAA